MEISYTDKSIFRVFDCIYFALRGQREFAMSLLLRGKYSVLVPDNAAAQELVKGWKERYKFQEVKPN